MVVITPTLAMQMIGFTTKVSALALEKSNPKLAENFALLSQLADAGAQTAGAFKSPSTGQTPQDPAPIPGIQGNPGPKTPKGGIGGSAAGAKGAKGAGLGIGQTPAQHPKVNIEGINKGGIGAFGQQFGTSDTIPNYNRASLFSDFDLYAG